MKVTRKLELKRQILLNILVWLPYYRSAFRKITGASVPLENSSGGFLLELLRLTNMFALGTNWIVVSEPVGVGTELENAVRLEFNRQVNITEFETAVGVKWSPQNFAADLCRQELVIPEDIKCDAVISQALLEHVVDPMMVVRNLLRLLEPGGVLVIQTHNPLMKIHRYPIDTLRYNEDWFLALPSYLNVEVSHLEVVQTSVFCVLRKL